MKWYNPQSEPFQITGFPFYEQDRVYRRMPLTSKPMLPESVYYLADETAGGQIRFHAKMKTMKIQVSIASRPLYFKDYTSPHLAETTKYGFDFYAAEEGGDYKFIGVTADYDVKNTADDGRLFYENTFVNSEEEMDIDVLLNFPLYGAVDKVLIGFDDDAEITVSHKQFMDDGKLVFYGGSIEQGACASRPGMSESNILSRWLNREVYNLGFNSSGKAEAEVARVIAGIEKIAALVISTEGNCPDGAWIEEKLSAFIQIFREKHPDTPVVVMPFPENASEMLVPAKRRRRLEKLEAQKKIVADRRETGDENIYLFSQDACMERSFEGNSVWHEFFSDGLHKTDIGYYAVAKGLYSFLKTVL